MPPARNPRGTGPTGAPPNGNGTSGRGWPITVALVLAIGALVLLSGATIFVLQWSVGRTNTLTLVNQVSELVLDRLEQDIRAHLKPARAQVEFVARQIENGEFGFEDSERLLTMMTGTLAAAPEVGGLAVWDRFRQRLQVRRGPGGEILTARLDDTEDPEVSRAFEDAAAAEGPYWGAPVQGPQRIALVNLRAPLRRDSETIGFVASVIAVPELSELVTDIGDSFGATAFVLYGEDRVLAHPNLAFSRPVLKQGEVLAAIDAVGDLVLADYWDAELVSAFDAPSGRADKVATTELGSREYVVVSRALDDLGAVPWTVGIWLDTADFGQEFRRLLHAGLAGIALLVLALAAAFLLGRFIARPVRESALGAARVGALELSRVEPLQPSLFRELNEQARAFNAMLASLRAFETYVPRALVRRMIDTGGEAAIASEERELTVLFTDIGGFTALSERESAATVAQFLNEHFALLGACVEAEGGTIDKFIGDALMAFWGAPDRQEDTAARACRAALAMARAIETDNAGRVAEGKPPVVLRIGIHTGPVVVGNIGAPGRINYTIVGDTVNTGQRLENLGKSMGVGDMVTILVSEATAERLGDGFRLESAGAVEVKGKQTAIAVYRLADGPGGTDPGG